MEEGLRLAYLAAMDVPVWLLRGSEPVPVFDEEPPPAREQAAPVAADTGPVRLARDLLGEDSGPRAGVTRAATPERSGAPARTAPRVAAQPTPSLLLVEAGRYLFIEASSEQGGDRRVVELIGAIALALGGEPVAPRAQRFDLQALGALADRAQARDVLLGRLARLGESQTVEHVVLLGERPAAVLLGWDEARFAGRIARVQRVPGLEPGVLVTLSCAQMLADAGLKRAVWQELCAARARHDA
ncbi:MAG TPA: hypothetical protein PLW13_04665 [Pseudomonadales bacterium]|nr:hypothetical protein [Pseudomonadales bacterium]